MKKGLIGKRPMPDPETGSHYDDGPVIEGFIYDEDGISFGEIAERTWASFLRKNKKDDNTVS